ncbi:MAG: TlpA disulfide reductase family protein [Desulfobacteraceae bacterium]|jgi:thioredoxin-like negative regulator of GroEL|nr:TlpA disulfide reductase family protein [Desulfobacteraceae bacterium]
MPIRCAALTLTAAIAVFSPCGLIFSAAGDELVQVKRLDLYQLDRMIHDPSNQCVVVFLAAWCHPCIEELPALNDIFSKYEGQGFKLVGVSLDLEGPLTIQSILTKHRVRFPVYWAGEGTTEKYGIKSIPLLWFVRSGQVVETLAGLRSKKFLERKIVEFLGRAG